MFRRCIAGAGGRWTIALNPAAHRAVLEIALPPGCWHDWWCYLVVSGVGGRVLFDPEPFILYRQHGANAVGVPGGFWTRAIRAARRGPAPFAAWMDAHLDGLAPHRERLTDANRAVFGRLRASRDAGPLGRVLGARAAGIHRQTAAEDRLLDLWLALPGGWRRG